MTQKPRRVKPSVETPAGSDAGRDVRERVTPQDRLGLLRHYADGDGLIPVVVAVAHDAVFAGQRLRVPVTDRVAGLVEIGFLEVELRGFPL